MAKLIQPSQKNYSLQRKASSKSVEIEQIIRHTDLELEQARQAFEKVKKEYSLLESFEQFKQEAINFIFNCELKNVKNDPVDPDSKPEDRTK